MKMKKETVEEQFKRLNDESVLPMAIDDGREIFVSMVGSLGKSRTHIRGIYDHIYVTYRDPDGKERTIRYFHRTKAS